MSGECPNCRAPIAREDQKYCYKCGQELSPSGPPPETRTEVLAAISDTPVKATLRVVLPTGDVFDRDVSEGETRLGKGPRNDIVIADPAVSTAHAVISAEAGAFTIADLGSRNGTFVDGERLTEPRRLNHGDVIAIGRSRLTFRLSGFTDTDTINVPRTTPTPPPFPPPPLTEESLATALVDAGLVSKENVERVRNANDRRLYRALLDERLVGQEALLDLMSRTFQLPIADTRSAEAIETSVVEIPARVITSLRILPLAASENSLTVAVADPTDAAALQEMEKHARRPLDLRLATADAIDEHIARRYGPKLVGVLPSGEKLEYGIRQSEIKIGKASHNDIVLGDPTVSNSHAMILGRDEGYHIVDLDSRNGTFVGGERLGDQPRLLKHGDSIQLGKTVLIFRDSSETGRNVTSNLSEDAVKELREQAREDSGNLVHEPEETAEKKKKKKKKKENERLKAAYVGAVSRIVAQVLGVLVALALGLYVAQRGLSPSSQKEGGDRGNVKKFGVPRGSGIAFQGGRFEASGVVQAPDRDGELLFIDDGRTDEILWMRVDESGNQEGSTVKIPLGTSVEDPEGMTYGGGFIYIVGSQLNPKGSANNALVRFVFDPSSQTVHGVETIQNFRDFLISIVPEMGNDLNIEGIAWDPVNERLLLGLRSPVVGGMAGLVPIKLSNPRGPFVTENLINPEPVKLSLGGYGVRDIHYDVRLRSFLIISGSTEHGGPAAFKLWEWSGDPAQGPAEANQLDPEMKPEGITRVRARGRDFLFLVGDASTYLKVDYLEAAPAN